MSHMTGRRGREARREHGRQVARLLDVVARAPRRGSTARTPYRAMSGGRTARDDEGGGARERRNAGVKLEEHG